MRKTLQNSSFDNLESFQYDSKNFKGLTYSLLVRHKWENGHSDILLVEVKFANILERNLAVAIII
jgi:hypothetical protein